MDPSRAQEQTFVGARAGLDGGAVAVDEDVGELGLEGVGDPLVGFGDGDGGAGDGLIPGLCRGSARLAVTKEGGARLWGRMSRKPPCIRGSQRKLPARRARGRRSKSKEISPEARPSASSVVSSRQCGSQEEPRRYISVFKCCGTPRSPFRGDGLDDGLIEHKSRGPLVARREDALWI